MKLSLLERHPLYPLQDKVGAILDAVSAELPADNHTDYWRVFGVLPDGGRITLTAEKDRLKIIAGRPWDETTACGSHEPSPSITVAASRPVADIVVELRRRLLPAYETHKASVAKALEETRTYEERCLERLQRWAKILQLPALSVRQTVSGPRVISTHGSETKPSERSIHGELFGESISVRGSDGYTTIYGDGLLEHLEKGVA